MIHNTERTNCVKVDHIPTTILTADADVKVELLFIDTTERYNPKRKNIGFNLKLVREESLKMLEWFYLCDFMINSDEYFDVIPKLRLDIFLKSGDRLECFTSADSQGCEVSIGYSTLDWKVKRIEEHYKNNKCE